MIQIEHASHVRAGMVRTNPGGAKGSTNILLIPTAGRQLSILTVLVCCQVRWRKIAIALKTALLLRQAHFEQALNFRIARDPGVRTIARELQETA